MTKRILYDEYTRNVPPINYHRGQEEPARTEAWIVMYDQPRSKPNRTEYGRPVSYLAWLQKHHPSTWLDKVFSRNDEYKPNKDFLNRRRGIWRCYGPEHGHVELHSSEKTQVYAFLRLICGPILESAEEKNGGTIWEDVTLTHYGQQLRANTARGQKILKTVWEIIEPEGGGEQE